MAVTAQTPYTSYTAAPFAVTFSTEFRVLRASDLVVRVNGVTQSSGFTLFGLGDSGGVDVQFDVSMTGGEFIELFRVVPLTRATDYQQLGDFLSPVVNQDFDRLWMSQQDQGFLINGALRLPFPEQVAALPAAAGRTRKLFYFDSTGAPVMFGGTPETVLGFDNLGNPVAVAPATGSATDLALSLAGTGGAGMVGFQQAGTGAATRTVQAKGRDSLSGMDFTGFDPLGVSDSYAAIVNAAAEAAASNRPLILRGNLRISAPLNLSAVKTVIAENANIIPDFDSGVAVTYSAAAGSLIENQKILGNLKVSWPTQDWTKNRTSFYFSNVYNGEFHLSSHRATRGVVCIGNERGVVHNDFHLGDMFNNSVGVWLDAVDATGWCNANRFHGGFFFGSGNPTGSLYAAQAGHIYTASSPYMVNGNVFLYPSLEWADTTGGFRMARLGGLRNRLLPIYCEISAGDTTWYVVTGEENLIDARSVPYIIGYDPTVSGSANRIDASGAVKPMILGNQGFIDLDGAGTQFVRTSSATRPAYDFANSDAAGDAVRISNGRLSFAGNTDIEGTFTALVAGSTTPGTASYSVAFGKYTRIGRTVFFTAAVSFTGHTGTGNMRVTNLPFTSDSNSENYAGVSIYGTDFALSSGHVPSAFIPPNAAFVNVMQTPTGTGTSIPVPMEAAATVYLSGHYFIP
jgi:hypothetical protein